MILKTVMSLNTRSVQISEFIKTVEVLSEKSHFNGFFLCGANVLMHRGCSVIVCNRAYQDDSVILKFKFNLSENFKTAPFVTSEFLLLWSLRNFEAQINRLLK